VISTLISLALKLGIPARFAKGAVIAALVACLVIGLGIGKCAYDKRVIANHEAKQEAATAKADRQADAKAAEQRRADDSRSTDEATEIKETINEAGNDPAARRAAYYRCVQLQQAARRERKPPADC
jgi:hypothetical protein